VVYSDCPQDTGESGLATPAPIGGRNPVFSRFIMALSWARGLVRRISEGLSEQYFQLRQRYPSGKLFF